MSLRNHNRLAMQGPGTKLKNTHAAPHANLWFCNLGTTLAIMFLATKTNMHITKTTVKPFLKIICQYYSIPIQWFVDFLFRCSFSISLKSDLPTQGLPKGHKAKSLPDPTNGSLTYQNEVSNCILLYICSESLSSY